MHTNLLNLLQKFKKELAAISIQTLHDSKGVHYNLMATHDIAPLIERTLNTFLASLGNETEDPFTNHIRSITFEGFAKGHPLEELQLYINCFYSSIVEIICKHGPRKYICSLIQDVTKRIFKAKDTLSRVYLEESLEAEDKLLHLKKGFADFLKTRDNK